jgi:hypothetical protein
MKFDLLRGIILGWAAAWVRFAGPEHKFIIVAEPFNV